MTNWKVYLLQCSDDTYYCGVTNKNIYDRIKVHNSGVGSKYTRGRLPVKLVFCTKNMSKSDAYSLEYRVKKLSKNKKLDYMKKFSG